MPGEDTPLHVAAKKGDEGEVARLIAGMANVNAGNGSLTTPLIYAAKEGHEGVCKKLMAANASANEKNKWKRAPLHWAAYGGHEGVCNMLVAANANLDAEDDGGETPLHEAAGRGREAVVELLVAAGANTEIKARSGWQAGMTPFDRAKGKFYEDNIRAAIERGLMKRGGAQAQPSAKDEAPAASAPAHSASHAAAAASGTILSAIDALQAKYARMKTLDWHEDDDIDVILSYRSIIDDDDKSELGKMLCEMLAQELKEVGFKPFHGLMVKGGANWQATWFGVMPEAKVAIVMFSPAFFKSKACVEELVKICTEPDLSTRIIPVFVGPVGMSKSDHFLGTEKSEKRQANLIRVKVDGNCIPPPHQGLFQDNWDANVATLVKRVREMMAKAD